MRPISAAGLYVLAPPKASRRQDELVPGVDPFASVFTDASGSTRDTGGVPEPVRPCSTADMSSSEPSDSRVSLSSLTLRILRADNPLGVDDAGRFLRRAVSWGLATPCTGADPVLDVSAAFGGVGAGDMARDSAREEARERVSGSESEEDE